MIYRIKITKRFLRACVLTLLVGFSLTTTAQNVQVHYDFGRNIYSSEQNDRPKLTITYETFKADNLGSWFYFVDIDVRNQGASGAYTEISREFNLGRQSPFAVHLEYG